MQTGAAGTVAARPAESRPHPPRRAQGGEAGISESETGCCRGREERLEEGDAGVDIVIGDQGVLVREDGAILLGYRAGGEHWKPYVYPLRLPGGPDLLEDAPADHPHHHGIWFGHGRLQTPGGMVDCWLEKPGCGTIRTTALREAPGGWEAESVWLDRGGAEVARDRRRFTVDLAPDRLTLGVDYHLEGEGVRLQGSNEAGLPHIRPAPWIAARGGGRAVDAEGRVGEAAIFGQASRAVDYGGTREGRTWGVAVFDHAANLGRPTRWFVRDYGPFSPNDGFFDPEPRALPVTLRYTVVAHAGGIAL